MSVLKRDTSAITWKRCQIGNTNGLSVGTKVGDLEQHNWWPLFCVFKLQNLVALWANCIEMVKE